MEERTIYQVEVDEQKSFYFNDINNFEPRIGEFAIGEGVHDYIMGRVIAKIVTNDTRRICGDDYDNMCEIMDIWTPEKAEKSLGAIVRE